MNRIHRMAVAGFFAGLLAVGLFIFRDYGIPWDEPIQRERVGLPSYLWMRYLDYQPLRQSPDRYYGPAFELALIGLEKILRLDDPREIYLARHLANFLVFYLAVVAFYTLLRRRVGGWAALAGAVLLVSSPRIFADSFYNSKDLAFLSFHIFALATLDAFLRRPTARTAVLHALVCAWLIDVRILGILVPAITVFLSWAGRPMRAVARPLAWFLALTAVFVVLFWPLLWRNPQYFIRSLVQMSRFHWPGQVLYLGEMVQATELPWHYAVVWIAVTTPLAQLALIAAGVAGFLARAAYRPLACLRQRPFDVAVFLAWLGPLVAVVGLRSVLYDGWRHLFFIYPALLYFGVLCLDGLARAWATQRPWARLAPAVALAAVVGCVAQTTWEMVRDHPHQNVYFNRLAGRDLGQIKRRFELDYWGVSCRRGLEYLVVHDPAKRIVVYAASDPVRFNVQMLPADQRERLLVTDDPGRAQYMVSHYRLHPDEYPAERDLYSVRVRGAKILVVQRLR